MQPAILLLVFMFAVLNSYWAVVIGVVTWFSYWYPAWGLFLASVLIDGYYGTFETVPVLSLSVGAFVLFVEVLKLHLVGTADHG